MDVIHLDAVRNALAVLPGEGGLASVTELLAVLSNPTRLKMLLALQPEAAERPVELCVCDLATVSGASKSLTSHQLRLLRVSGLVRQRRAGKLTYYRLADGPFVSLLADLARLARERDPSESTEGPDATDSSAVQRLGAATGRRGASHGR